MRDLRSRFAHSVVVVLLMFVAGCNDDFNPFATGTAEFSVFGYLDASADTQWIRVMPIRHELVGPRQLEPTTVVLEEVGTGRTIELIDSVFVHQLSPFDPEARIEARNYWTTDAIEPGASYDITITRSDGTTATARVAIPEMFSVTVSHHPFLDALATIRIEGVENLGIVQVREIIGRRACYATPFRLPEAAADGTYTLPLSRSVLPEFNCGQREDILVVSSAEPWPVGPAFEVGALDVPSTIANGVGFLGGVVSRAIPWETCRLNVPEPCVLAYDADASILEGTVIDAVCGGPIVQALVELSEIRDDPETPVRTRTVRTGLDGRYRIEALSPGVPHALKVAPPQTVYGSHEDTLVFGAGEHRRVDFPLQRSSSC